MATQQNDTTVNNVVIFLVGGLLTRSKLTSNMPIFSEK